jgi:hypothetical protein
VAAVSTLWFATMSYPHHPGLIEVADRQVTDARWVKQTKKGGGDAPPEERGDCVAACIASILGLTHPGNLTNTHGDGWWDRLQADVARFGYALGLMDVRFDPPDAYWIASVPSLNLGPDPDGKPAFHCIVCRGREFVHDPSIGEHVYDGARWAEAWNDDKVAEGWLLVPLDPAQV